MFDFLADLSTDLRVVAIVLVAVAAHFIVRGLRWISERSTVQHGGGREQLWRERPKFATVVTIVVSALTFAIYFAAIGLILNELGVNLTTYVASASVIGLAVGFGLQGFVQDVVVGLTLIFTDVLTIGDMVDISGQTGRVQRIGLRFTTLLNFLDQKVNIPNRNVAQINRYRRGYVRAYVDVQVPDGAHVEDFAATTERLAQGMRQQFPAVILTDPESMGVKAAEAGNWRYVRIKFKLWPGQGVIIETAFKQRLLSTLKSSFPDYADWMVSVSYRAS